MMAFYSPSFRHDGLTARDLDSLLTYRLLDGSIRIKGVDAYPLYEDTLASCVIDVYYTRSGIRDTVHIEPGGEYDDISYWKKEGDYWKLNGNQLGTPVMEGGDSGE